MTSPKKKATKIVLSVLAVLLLLYGAYLWQFEIRGNVHAVTPGEVYRSGQLSAARLKEVVAEHGIRSVLNLRGATPGESWYDDEMRVSRELGLTHYDVGIRARFEPPPERVAAILEVFKNAPRPLLIHCRAGADRAGLVSAMWKVVMEGQSKDEAAGQLSVKYGHLPFGQAAPMDTFFDRWQPE